MEWFSRWLLGVIVCALLVSIAVQFCCAGSMKKLLRFTGALLLLLAMLEPLAAFRLPVEIPLWENLSEAMAHIEPELSQVREDTLLSGIAAELKTYIENQARKFGTEVCAEVTLTLQDGVAIPENVTLWGIYSEALSDLIASELGIAKEKQQWIEDK